VTHSLYLLVVIGILGAADTIYFHEWRARLPVLGKQAGAELRLHAARDLVYAIVFVSLPWICWCGRWAAVLVLLLSVEVVLTMWDFVVEDWVRKPLGGVYPAERVMHAAIGIVYGAMLVLILPSVRVWWGQPTGLARSDVQVSRGLRWLFLAMALGVLASGIRDLCASFNVHGSAWPWKRE
jgi:hypothetical protein